MHLRALDMRRYRVGKVSQLGDVRRASNINALCEIVDTRVASSQTRRQATVKRGIEQFGELGKDEFAKVVQGETSALHGVGNGHSLEVTTMVDIPSRAVDERVVRGCGDKNEP